jgi:hypothetical protein
MNMIRDVRRAFSHSQGEREPAARLPIAFFGGSAVTIYWISHKLVGAEDTYADETLFSGLARVSCEQTTLLVFGIALLCSLVPRQA